MFIYFACAILVYLFGLFHRISQSEIVKKTTFTFVFIILWLISGFRYMVGTDYPAYYNYKKILGIDFSSIKNHEYGFWLLKNISYTISTSGLLFILLSSFITLILIISTLRKQAFYFEISILMFLGFGYYFNSMNTVKQFIAIGLLIYSINYLYKSKYLLHSCFVLIAMSFHFTAIIGFLFLPLYLIRRNNAINNLVVIGSSALLIYIFPIITKLFLNINYSSYENTRFLEEGSNTIYFVFYLLIVIVLFIFRKKLEGVNPHNSFYLKLFIVGLAFLYIGTNSLLIMRIAEYFMVFIIIALPELIRVITPKTSIYILMVIVSLLAMYLFLSRNLSGVLPYRFFN